jgi:hypothetical protein
MVNFNTYVAGAGDYLFTTVTVAVANFVESATLTAFTVTVRAEEGAV